MFGAGTAKLQVKCVPQQPAGLWCERAVQADNISFLQHCFKLSPAAFGVDAYDMHAYGLRRLS